MKRNARTYIWWTILWFLRVLYIDPRSNKWVTVFTDIHWSPNLFDAFQNSSVIDVRFYWCSTPW